MPQRILTATYIVALFAAITLLTLHANLHKDFNHDEHMYVAGGALIARDGLLPYRDFPYFQMPNLALIYSGLSLFNTHLLLAARIFSTLCALLTCALLFYAAWRAFGKHFTTSRLLAGTGAIFLLLLNPVYFYSSGIAWNHDPSVMFGVLSCVLFIEGARRGSLKWWGFAGLALGLAIGSRLTFAFALLPLVPSLLVGAAHRLQVFSRVAILLAGCLAALLPSITLFALSPDRFLFNNVGYHLANEEYYLVTGYTRAVDPLGKLSYLLEVAASPGAMPLFALTLIVTIPLCVLLARQGGTRWFGCAAGMGIALSLMLGALASSPTWLQYFYAPVPFLILAALYALGEVRPPTDLFRTAGFLYATAVLVSLAIGWPQYAREGSLLRPERWVPVVVHERGLQLRQLVPTGPVLTLAPLIPLEGDLRIYPALATGPFAWRSGTFLSPEERRALGVVSEANLTTYLAAQPPAILTGYEEIWEGALVEYARRRGYQEILLGDGRAVWLER